MLDLSHFGFYSNEIFFSKLREKIDIIELVRLKKEIWNKNDDFQKQIDTLNAKIYQINKLECPSRDEFVEFQSRVVQKPEIDEVNLGRASD